MTLTARHRLQQLLRSLDCRLSQRAGAGNGHGDEGDVARQVVEREITSEARSRMLARRAAIAAALARVEDGTYGWCDCGDRIDARRLRAIPETDECVTCAMLRERSDG